jgi:SpoVK/Ycf46/Vps4 family AAA+-type ATPase
MSKNRHGTWSVDPEYARAATVESSAPVGGAPESPAEEPRAERQTQSAERERMELFVVEAPRRRLTDLIVPDATMQQIKSMLAKVEHHAFLYEHWNLKKIDPYGGRTTINLYGPPGTGKSFCAEAIAAELNRSLIRVNYAEIESKYVGDTPKNIQAAFAKARQENVLLFFDEADSILGRRLTNVTQSADHGVNVSRSVMLMELDHFAGVTVFATNLASNYDGAFVRRILSHIEMPLPNNECRRRLWQLHIPQEMENNLEHGDYQTLAAQSDGLSGGDILNIVISAATLAVQRVGAERRVTLDDLLLAVEQGRKAKEEVGNTGGRMGYQMTRMPVELAPDDIQNQLRERDVDHIS